ncbi:MAG: hypothetical protein AAGD22_00905 [Verrucomicrobiota bacterium]
MSNPSTTAVLLLLSAFLIQCTSTPEKTLTPETAILLNSERIKQRYGTYDIKLISQTHTGRVSNLYSTDNGIPTTRTLAFVRFHAPSPPKDIESLHHTIVAGASLGATFKQAGWQVIKHRHRLGSASISTHASHAPNIARLMQLTLPITLAAHSYQLDVRKGDQVIPYATLTEIHHPDYLTLDTLRKLYP